MKPAADRSVEGIVFEFTPGARVSREALDEVTKFLDTQVISHPFQYPGWSPIRSWVPSAKTFCCVLRSEQTIRFFGRGGILFPGSRLVPNFRAITFERGPICDDLELMKYGLTQIVTSAKKAALVYVDISPEAQGGEAAALSAWLSERGWTHTDQPGMSLRLSLASPPSALLAGFRKTTRYEIRRAERSGIFIRQARDHRDFDAFHELYRQMAEHKGFTAEGHGLMRYVFDWCRSDQNRGVLLLAYDGTALRGGVLVARASNRSRYIWGATRKDGASSVGHLLQWTALNWARDVGCCEYDFGGYRGDSQSGPALFKSGFSSQIFRFMPSHRLVLDERRYQACQRMHRLVKFLRHRDRLPC